MKKIVLFLGVFFSVSLTAQVYVIEDGVTINACSGIFVDTGGETNSYSGNESITYTICPEFAGQKVQLQFTTFVTQEGADFMTVYDAADALDPTTSFGDFSGSPDVSVFVSATNTSGCLTFVFTSNGGVNFEGWTADISCFEPCQDMTAVLESSNPAPNAEGEIIICSGGDVDFVGGGIFSIDPTGATYSWDFGNDSSAVGTNVTATYNDPGIYVVDLVIMDDNPIGCTNLNAISQVVRVTPEIEFTGTQAAQTSICYGDSTTIVGAAAIPQFEDCTPEIFEESWLEDTQTTGFGTSYDSTITVDCYGPGQLFNDVSQIQNFCVNIEHSFIGDLDIYLIAPNGAEVYFLEYGDGVDPGINLGIPDQADDGNPGIGFEYCFSPTATESMNDVTDVNTIPEGTYAPLNTSSFDNLLGSPLNGNWTFVVVDSWAVDDGTLFSWNLNFDPALFPPSNSIVSETWDADSTITDTTDTTITVQPPNEGQYCYTYRAFDDVGCEYTEEVCIEVSPELTYADPIDLFVCDTGTTTGVFNLTENDAIISAPTPDPGDFDITYHESQSDADADSNPITATDAASYSGTDGQIIYVRFEYKTSGCYETVFFTLNLLDPPVISAVSDMVECDDITNDGTYSFDLSEQTLDILGSQLPENYTVSYYLSFADADAGTNNLSSPYNNVSSPEPIYVRVDANGGAECYFVDPNPVFNLVVNHKATTSVLSPIPTCDDDFDGIMTFDLEQQTTLVLGSQIPSDFLVTYHESQADADTNSYPLTSPYSNTTTNQQTIFVRVEEIGLEACYETTQFDIIVNPLPTTTTMTALPVCESDGDGIGVFELTSKDVEALGGQTGVTVSYHETQSDADTNTSPLSSPYTNTTAYSQIVFIRLENNTTGCFSTMPLELSVNPIPTANPVGTQSTCDDDYDGFTTFDFTGLDSTVIGSQLGMVVSYHETQANADTNTSPVTSPYTNITATTQTLFIRLENSTTGCFDTTTLELFVDPLPVIPSIIDYELCDYNNTGDLQEAFDLSTKDSEIIDGQNVSVAYYESEPDAINDNNALTGPYQNTSTPQTLHVALTDLTTGCRATGSFILIVNPLPQLVVPTVLEVCDDGTPDGLTQIDLTEKDDEITGGNADYLVAYYLTQADADSETNSLTIPYPNIYNPQTVFARGQDINTGCYTTVELELNVSPAPLAITPRDLPICDLDSDGFEAFMLTDRDLEISNGISGVTISYHENISDAENEINALSSPYTNTQINTQTVFARVEDPAVSTLCASIVELVLVVNPTPQLLDPTPLKVCDDDTDKFQQFNLTNKADELLNGIPITDVNISYYETQADAQAETFEIVDPTDYTNLSNPQTVWIRVAYKDSNCEKLVSLDLIVDPLPVFFKTPTTIPLCDYNAPGDKQEAFTLEDKESEILDGQTGLDISYFLTAFDAQANSSPLSSPYTNISNPQTIFVRVSDPTTGCYDFTTLNLEVLPIPTPQKPTDLDECDYNASGDGQEVFDLTTNESVILNGESGVTPTYYETQTDADAGINFIQFPDNYTNTDIPSQTIYVRVTNDLTGCYAIVDFDVIVDPLPEAIDDDVKPLIACELNTDGIYAFDLEVQSDLVRGTQSATEYDVTYHESLADATLAVNPLTSPYMNTSNPQTIYVNVTNINTGCQNTTVEFNVEVLEAAQATSPASPYAICDDNVETDNDPTNDSALFDLTTQDAFVLNGQDPANYLVRYFASQTDADLDQFELPSLYQNTVNPQVIFARVDNNTQIVDSNGTLIDISECYETAPLVLMVNPLPYIDMEDEYVMCVDSNGTEVLGPLEITTGLSDSDYIFIWRDDTGTVVETTSSYIPSEAGVYTLEVSDAIFATQCAAPIEAFTVIESGPPTVTAVVTTPAFANTHIIEATATGLGDFEYNIDQGPWQETGTFVGVSPGDHVVNVRDLNGCGVGRDAVYIIDFPKYFTPNGDGFHDIWNIAGISSQLNAKIQIFDRYGKFLKEIRPSGDGWDGTYNGVMLPSSDYWFVLSYNEPVTGEPTLLNAHFTLKR